MNTTGTTIPTVLTNTQLTILVTLSIVALLLCIYCVFIFGRRLQSNAVARSELVDTIKEKEYYRLEDALRSKAAYGGVPLDSKKNPVPEGYNRFKEFWYPAYYKSAAPSFDDSEEGQKGEEEWKANNKLFTSWEQREKEIFKEMCKDLEGKALKYAEEKVPKTMDVSVLGGGFAFLLEFSTIIVIIFTLLILGILGSLEGKEIATILASIAGYVLGKVSSQNKESTSQASSTINAQQK